MIVRRYRLTARHGEARELRVAHTGGLVFFAVHVLDKCITGPLGLLPADLATLARAVADAENVASVKEPTP